MGGTAVTAERVIGGIRGLSLADLAAAFARVGASSAAEVVEQQQVERRERAQQAAARLAGGAVDPSTDPAWPSATKLAIGEWCDYGNRPRESWDYKDADEKAAEIAAQLRRARWLLADGGLIDSTPRAS